MTNVEVLYESNYRDVASTLRVIAQQVDDGEYGDVRCFAGVILGDETAVFGAGPDSSVSMDAMVLHTGFTKLARLIEDD